MYHRETKQQQVWALGWNCNSCDIRIHTKIQWRFFVRDFELSIEKKWLSCDSTVRSVYIVLSINFRVNVSFGYFEVREGYAYTRVPLAGCRSLCWRISLLHPFFLQKEEFRNSLFQKIFAFCVLAIQQYWSSTYSTQNLLLSCYTNVSYCLFWSLAAEVYSGEYIWQKSIKSSINQFVTISFNPLWYTTAGDVFPSTATPGLLDSSLTATFACPG